MIPLSVTLTRIGVAALFVAALLAHASIVHAAPAHDAPFVLRQPDGTPFEARLFGDEWMNGTETVEGYTIVQDAASGYWTYADTTSTGALVSTVYVVGRDRPSAIPRGLRPPAIAPAAAPEGFGPEPGVPAVGSRPMLVLLVQFSDRSGHTTAAQWRSRFFGAGESVREHYRSASMGALDITPAAERHGTANDGIVGWLTLDRAHPDFGGTVDGRAGQLARDAMTAASRHVDFAAFDTDGDGRVSTSELCWWSWSSRATTPRCRAPAGRACGVTSRRSGRCRSTASSSRPTRWWARAIARRRPRSTTSRTRSITCSAWPTSQPPSRASTALWPR